ncbi:hypothetical protein PHYPSEUDO_006809 [Phytophthora pseudosyringae]|uniref:Glutamate carboxypeptidase n=1 Tax=Phytophthora pseudosyringae TaxID=221518 RepID=A0A8T1VHQ4_9STRA|nr:hypothetical protein PHYPSEUDO_006809 [Phytophthora pseudosyringae]
MNGARQERIAIVDGQRLQDDRGAYGTVNSVANVRPTTTRALQVFAVSSTLTCLAIYWLIMSASVEPPLTATKSVNMSSLNAFVDGVQSDKLREFLHAYASKPHTCGTAQDYETALYTAEQFQSFGLDVELKTYNTLLSYPVRRRLAIVESASTVRELNLTEGIVSGDACTADSTALPPFLAYSPSGNVTASVVYANYGSREDFEWLETNNVSLRGKIALIRLGGGVFRGLKVMTAVAFGLAGALLYSDPLDDGFALGAVYPDGPWRPEDSFQRGSVYVECGDPLTPGWASVPGAKYLKYEDVGTIPHIPALPLSYGQAKRIFELMGGRHAPTAWQGGLRLADDYNIGDDESTVVNLELEVNNTVGPIWDVIGSIKGYDAPDQQVILGNHRDAWVCGAVDPGSGSSALLEIARGLGELVKHGWRPRRTLVLASWDGEEYGLLGSTEFVEESADLLKQQAVAYINVDTAVGPVISADGSPAITKLLVDTAKVVPAKRFFGNESDKTLYDQWLAQSDGEAGVLGSSSDFAAFIEHLGVTSANLRFKLDRTHQYGTYHSSMDSVASSETFADPNYATHVTTARWWGLVALRLADDVVIPFDFTSYAGVMTDALSAFASELKEAVALAVLRDAITHFHDNAGLFHRRLEAAVATGTRLKWWNQRLQLVERQFTLDKGLPHRPWYKHVVIGGGSDALYAGVAFPGLADCLVFRDDSHATQTHVEDVARVVNGAAEFLGTTAPEASTSA